MNRVNPSYYSKREREEYRISERIATLRHYIEQLSSVRPENLTATGKRRLSAYRKQLAALLEDREIPL